jgi:hypothetical protein
MTTASATRPWPQLAEERAAVREAIRLGAIARAEREATRLSRSIKCGAWNNHAPQGCQNTGDNCICQCHDLADVQ